jgi:hypothetical protein
VICRTHTIKRFSTHAAGSLQEHCILLASLKRCSYPFLKRESGFCSKDEMNRIDGVTEARAQIAYKEPFTRLSGRSSPLTTYTQPRPTHPPPLKGQFMKSPSCNNYRYVRQLYTIPHDFATASLSILNSHPEKFRLPSKDAAGRLAGSIASSIIENDQ